MARLEHWTLHTYVDTDNKPYQYLTGTVRDHPKADPVKKILIDGHSIRTSKVVSIDMEKHVVITQTGTVYELGVKDK